MICWGLEGIQTNKGQQVIEVLLYSKTCVKLPLSKGPKNGFQDQLSLNADQSGAFCNNFDLH